MLLKPRIPVITFATFPASMSHTHNFDIRHDVLRMISKGSGVERENTDDPVFFVHHDCEREREQDPGQASVHTRLTVTHGESLFTFFASLTYAYRYLMELIKQTG